MIPSVVGARLGATLAGFAIGLAGAGVAAYSGSLPPSLQNAAHAAIGAPAAPPNDASTPAPGTTKDDLDGVGPDATGPAAHGLCNAWSQHQRNGAKPTGSVASRNLAKAAGGEAKIAAYCATIPHPGHGHGAANGKGKGTGNGTGNEKDKSGKEKGFESSPGTPTVPKPTSTRQSSTPRITPSTATPSTATPTPTSTARSTTATPSTTTTSSTSSSTSSP